MLPSVTLDAPPPPLTRSPVSPSMPALVLFIISMIQSTFLYLSETCRCLRDFYTNWFGYMPYANTSDSGIFPPLVRASIYDVCGNCSEYGRPRIHFQLDYQGNLAKKHSLVEVKQSMNDRSQINFPVIGRKDSKSFLPIIDSPGSVFVTKKPSLTMVVEYGFLETIIGTLPLLGFSIITASLAGVIMWCLVGVDVL